MAAADGEHVQHSSSGQLYTGGGVALETAGAGGAVGTLRVSVCGSAAALVARGGAWPGGGQGALEGFVEALRGRDLLVVGSGIDLVGRRLGARIDRGDFGLVARVNKPYGEPLDAGRRMDLLVTRWSSWLGRFFPGWGYTGPVLVLNEHKGMSEAEHRAACLEVGWQHVSAGVLACMWALNRGARRVRVVGFGYDPLRGWAADKRYPDREKDGNPLYHWKQEQRWLAQNVEHLRP